MCRYFTERILRELPNIPIYRSQLCVANFLHSRYLQAIVAEGKKKEALEKEALQNEALQNEALQKAVEIYNECNPSDQKTSDTLTDEDVVALVPHDFYDQLKANDWTLDSIREKDDIVKMRKLTASLNNLDHSQSVVILEADLVPMREEFLSQNQS